jgi:hypothetical protein
MPNLTGVGFFCGRNTRPLFRIDLCSLLNIFYGTKTLPLRGVAVAYCDQGARVENAPIILDNDLVQSVLEDVLTDGGFQVVITSSGEKAVELLDTSGGNTEHSPQTLTLEQQAHFPSRHLGRAHAL